MIKRPEGTSAAPDRTEKRNSDDDFGDLVNPTTSSSTNPSEIDINTLSSSSSSDSDTEPTKTPKLLNKNGSLDMSFSSFIETPAHRQSLTSTTDSAAEDTPVKRPKLIRRNQDLYTPSKDEC